MLVVAALGSPVHAEPFEIQCCGIFISLRPPDPTPFVGLTFSSGPFDPDLFLAQPGTSTGFTIDPVLPREFLLGDQVSLATTIRTNGVIPGFQGSGSSFRNVFFSGAFEIAAGEVTVAGPQVPTGIQLPTPFTLTGSLTIARDEALTDVIFDDDVFGVGLASLFVTSIQSPFYFYDRQVYGFTKEHLPQPPAPVPEPVSVLLVGSGVAMLAAARQRRRAREVASSAGSP